MTRWNKISISCVALATGLMSPFLATAAPARLRLDTNTTSVVAGQEFQVDVHAETPTIYGAEMRLGFDPNVLEVVDVDAATGGTQVTPGSFLPVRQGFVLRNSADNQKGVVTFAVTLLRPASAVQGEGSLATVRFRARRAGVAEIGLTEGLFGTEKGEAIAPVLEGRTVNIREAGVVAAALAAPAAAAAVAARWRDTMGGGRVVLAGILLVAVVLGPTCVALTRRRKRAGAHR